MVLSSCSIAAVEECMQGCRHSFVIVLVTVLSPGSKLEDFLQHCMGGYGKAKKGARSGVNS